MSSTTPVFTRYLYEFHQVKHSLQIALFEKQREEALFWAYELYHSGFEVDVWYWVREIYVTFYEEHNPKFKLRLDQFYKEWKETNDACLLGTIVGTLALRERQPPLSTRNGERFLIMYKEDRHKTAQVIDKPRYYLQQTSGFPIRKETVEFPEKIREAYLGENWLYYCAETPIWETRIHECGGKVVGEKVEFETDDLLELFYERWGFEPDEQPIEIHQYRGIYLQ